MKEERSVTSYQKRLRLREWLLMGLTFVLALGAELGGVVLGVSAGAGVRSAAGVLQWVLLGLLLLTLPVNVLLRRRFVTRLNRVEIARAQRSLLQKRERAEEETLRQLGMLRKLRRGTDLYGLALALLALLMCFCAGVGGNLSASVGLCLIGMQFILGALGRIRFRAPESVFESDESYLEPEAYPELHGLAYEAARALGCDGDIRIAVITDFNVGIGKVGDTYSIRLGAELLHVVGRGELYSILLHEFGHMTQDKAEEAHREGVYLYWMQDNPYSFFQALSMPYWYADEVYAFRYALFDYAGSVLRETRADEAMAKYGDRAVAASAMLKLKYHELYDWEKSTWDKECFFAPEQLPASIIRPEAEKFLRAMEQRQALWRQLVDQEILSRNASHPTLKMRLETLGVSDPRLLPTEDAPAYRAECDRAVDHVEAILHKNGLEAYEEGRKENYLEPLRLVTKWEKAGRPLAMDTYADLEGALRSLGRVTEAMELCDRAIRELDGAAACHARFIKGCCLLHSWDPAGIEYVYHAVENNTNYIDEGMEMIGSFCCLTGRQEELEEYRRRAPELGQRNRDVYSEMSVLRKTDRLEPEQLPEELMWGIMDFIRSVDDGCVWKVYLVRKIITEDFFVTAVVIRFSEGAPRERHDAVLNRVFRYLDGCSDWQFTLFHYDDVRKARLDKLPGACVYEK